MEGEWQTQRFERMAQLVRDAVHPSEAVGLPYIGLEHIGEGSLSLVGIGVAEDATSLKSRFRRGDVLFGKLRPYFRKVIRAPFDGICSTDIWVVRPRSGVDAGFLFYLMASDLFIEPVVRASEGTKMPRAQWEYATALEQPLPPLPEQRAIAHILGTLDDKIELNRRMNETLEAMARALFKSWFVDFEPVRAKAEGRWKRGQSLPGIPAHLYELFPDRFVNSELGEIPGGWDVGVLDQLVDSVLGGDWGGDKQDAERMEAVRCIRGADIPDLQIGGTGQMPVRYLKPSSLARRRLCDGDLVIEISGGSPTQSTGRPVLVLRELLDRLHLPLVCSNFCRLVKLRSSAQAKFVYLWLRSLYANDELLQFENGTTGIKNLAFSLFSSTFKLLVPPAPTLEAFDQFVSPWFRRQQVGAEEADNLAALRDALLPKLISGEMRINNVERYLGKASG